MRARHKKEEKRQTLVAAALRAFAERGYHRATIQDVASYAGVSKGSVYDYFDSKEAILSYSAEVLLRSLVEQSVSRFEQDPRSLRVRVEAFVSSLLDSVEEWLPVCLSLVQVWAELGSQGEGPLKQLLAGIYRHSVDRVARVFDHAVDRGETPPFETREAALTIFATCDGLLLQALVIPDEFERLKRSGLAARWCASLVPPGPQKEQAG